MIERFVDPYTKQELNKDAQGNLYCSQGDSVRSYKCHDGCCDFVVARENIKTTRECYDEGYSEKGECHSDVVCKNTDTLVLKSRAVMLPWQDHTVPWRKTMLNSLGDLSGKRILLLGNGRSYKEFYFLHLGAHIVFTDLSLVAAMRAKEVFMHSELWGKYHDKIEFHAVDAMRMPFKDETFDIIYGSKFVGFLDDHGLFFAEVYRCLKPQGLCRFSDDAYSPVWASIKQTVLRPVQKWILHSPTALDQLRGAGKEGGFKKQYLASFKEQYGFKKLLFEREYFFLRITQLTFGKLVHWNPKPLLLLKPLFFLVKWVDICFSKTNWMERNAISLTWGFDK